MTHTQVHLYDQEFNGYVRHTSQSVPKVRKEERQPFEPVKKVKKLIPLLMKNRHFVDTAFMCVTAASLLPQANKWVHSSYLISRDNCALSFNCYSCVYYLMKRMLIGCLFITRNVAF